MDDEHSSECARLHVPDDVHCVWDMLELMNLFLGSMNLETHPVDFDPRDREALSAKFVRAARDVAGWVGTEDHIMYHAHKLVERRYREHVAAGGSLSNFTVTP